MSKYTLGPWVWTEYDKETEELATLKSSFGYNICNFGVCTAYSNRCGDEPNNADKLLIASAPDLLEALTALLLMCKRQDDFNDDGDGRMFERADAAIAKALGE